MLPRIEIFAIYFGVLPEYFDFWLDGCKKNPRFNWNLIIDRPLATGYILPENVRVIISSLVEIEDIFKKSIDPKIFIRTPYKLCDFRPAYSHLLEPFSIKCDYWGHTDLDMVYGDLSSFWTPEVLSKHEKIFSEGHLALYRNSPIVNAAYKMRGGELFWKEVFETEANIGFDEEHGINSIMQAQGIPLFDSRRIIADMLPKYSSIVLNDRAMNKGCPIINRISGKMYVRDASRTAKNDTEVAYVHFQKRAMQKLADSVSAQGDYQVHEGGFKPLYKDEGRKIRIWSFPDRIAYMKMNLRNIRKAL